MTEYEKILLEFDQFFNKMLVLADICEEEGKLEKALAWRTIHRWKKIPNWSKKGKGWYWRYEEIKFQSQGNKIPLYLQKDIEKFAYFQIISEAYEYLVNLLEGNFKFEKQQTVQQLKVKRKKKND